MGFLIKFNSVDDSNSIQFSQVGTMIEGYSGGGGGPNTAIPHEKVSKYRNTASKNCKIPQTVEK